MQSEIYSPENVSPMAPYFGTLSEIWLLDYKALLTPILSWDPELLSLPVPSKELLVNIPFRPESATLQIKPVDSTQGDAFTASISFEILANKETTMQAILSWMGKRVFALCRPAGGGLIWGIAPLVVSSSFDQGSNYGTASRFPITLQPKGPLCKVWFTDHWKKPTTHLKAFDQGFSNSFS